MEIKFTERNLKKLDEIKSRYPDNSSVLMPALWLAQEQFGWISTEVMEYVGSLLNIPYEQVYGVVNFYTMYNAKPIGKHHLQVCTNVSCMLRGGYDILGYISSKLNIKTGETTENRKFTLSEVECLGSCGTAPMMQVNSYFEENLTKEKIDTILQKLSAEN
ncbi:MAG: NADH-quinone oxidoreductase subunit NuoE [Ignavibacteria bacterium]